MEFSKTDYLDIFIEQFQNFLDEIGIIFKNDIKIQTLKTFLYLLCGTNKKRIIEFWKNEVVERYREQINQNDYNFFIENDWNEVIYHSQKDLILEKINQIRFAIRNESVNNKEKTIKYVEVLSKLSDLYYSETLI